MLPENKITHYNILCPPRITDRLPTEWDGDEEGYVQVEHNGLVFLSDWMAVQDHNPWFHTPRWVPRPPKSSLEDMEALARDAVAALRYIESTAGRLHGVGWDRVYEAAEKCLGVVHEKPREPPTPLVGGDYVFATKWEDGDSCDPHAVGFVSEIDEPRGRYLVVDTSGKLIYGPNGFRRAEIITKDEGDAMMQYMKTHSDKPGTPLWDVLEQIRYELEEDLL